MPNLQNNLHALQLINPKLADGLKEFSAGTVSVLPDFQPNVFQAQLQQLSQKQIKQIVLIGAGSGRVIQRIIDVLNPLRVVVIDEKPEPLLAMLDQHDYAALIQDRLLFFGLGIDIQTLETGLLPVKASLAAHGYQIIVNPEVYEDDSPEISRIVQNIQLIIEQESLFLRMRLARADLCQLNLLQNIPTMLNSISNDSLVKLCEGKSALIIAAGPSLDESVAEIKQVQNRFVIFAVDTAVRTLLKHGIHPHVVITTDPTKDNAKHFDGVELNQNTILAFTPDCQTHNVQMHQSYPHKICLFDDSTHLSYWMQNHLGFTSIFNRPLNVSEAAVRLAVHMGFSAVVFSGLDLAVPVNGGSTHSSEAAHSFAVADHQSGKIQLRKHDGSEEWLPVVAVEGWDEERVYTYPSFQMYLRELEAIIKKTPIRWIDCTKYGAKKEGCQRMTLVKTAEEFGQPVEDVQQTVAQVQNTKRFDSVLSIQALKDGIDVLEQYQSHFEKIVSHENSYPEEETIWDEFLHDTTVRAILDHAVFRFQFTEPIKRVDTTLRHGVIQQHARDAHQVLSVYLPILRHIVQSLYTDA